MEANDKISTSVAAQLLGIKAESLRRNIHRHQSLRDKLGATKGFDTWYMERAKVLEYAKTRRPNSKTKLSNRDEPSSST